MNGRWRNPDRYQVVGQPGREDPHFLHVQDYVINTASANDVSTSATRDSETGQVRVVECKDGQQLFNYLPNQEGYEQLLEDVRTGATITCAHEHGMSQKNIYREKAGQVAVQP